VSEKETKATPSLVLGVLVLGLLAGAPATAHAEPELAALAPADDVREVIALGPYGEVYAPDGKGAWVREQPITVADRIRHAGRAGRSVVVLAGGAVYRLAPNGWTALRLAQRGTAVMSPGRDAVGAVGRMLLSLDTFERNGEPKKIVRAPHPITAIGSGKDIVIATERGLFRVQGRRVKPIRSPERVDQLVDDRWALVERGAIDLTTGKTVPWPAGVRVVVAASGPGDSLVAVADSGGSLVLVTVKGGKLTRESLPTTITGTPVGVVVDGSGRAIVALAEGQLALRERGRWSVLTVTERLPSPRPGSAPARLP